MRRRCFSGASFVELCNIVAHSLQAAPQYAMKYVGLILAAGGLALTFGCAEARSEPASGSVSESSDGTEGTGAIASDSEGNAIEDPLAAYPLHGLVTGLQLQVRRRPHPDSEIIGWLRIGNRVRTKGIAQRTEKCSSGWHAIYPKGFACKGQGLLIGDAPPESETETTPPDRSSALPYTYWYVKEDLTPEYHRKPSRGEQVRADRFAARYLELLEDNEDKAKRFRSEELVEDETTKPRVVHRFLDRGFFVAGVASEVRSGRRFIRTVRGRYVPQSRLIQRTGSEFHGVPLDGGESLPIVWARRTAHFRIRRERDDGVRFVKDMEREPIERHARIDGWLRQINEDGKEYHVLETEDGERYVREWFLSVAEARSKPRRVGDDEPWVHINLGRQTLVMYEGERPVFATLVSSGQAGFETPTGLFRIQKKYVADTMANIGDNNDDRYSIEDVPWAQYFDRSIAIHGAFWHTRFGLERSHGCVNLSPADARHVFSVLWPRVPDNWLGVQVAGPHAFPTSHVLVTED